MLQALGIGFANLIKIGRADGKQADSHP